MAKIKLGGDITGFWRPEMKGDKLVGVLDGYSDTDQPFFIFRVLLPIVVSADTGKVDEDKKVYQDIKAAKGDRVGMSAYKQLLNLNLNRYEGHLMEIIFKGEKKMGPGKNPMKVFEVEVDTERYVPGNKKVTSKQNDDDDIPF